jgi:transcriptional regulator with XRE-family HTH domain
MDPQEAFVTRLRRYRERYRISLDEIASEHNIRRDLLEAFENNDLSQWPRGLYARAWIRAYATAVGLDPDSSVDEFCRLFPHGDRRAQGTIREIAAIVASPSEYRDEIDHEDRRHSADQEPIAEEPEWHAPLVDAARTLRTRLGVNAAPGRRAPRTS